MRIILTPEISKLYDEVKPYYDKNFHLIANAPEDIKKKDAIIKAYNEKELKKASEFNR